MTRRLRRLANGLYPHKLVGFHVKLVAVRLPLTDHHDFVSPRDRVSCRGDHFARLGVDKRSIVCS